MVQFTTISGHFWPTPSISFTKLGTISHFELIEPQFVKDIKGVGQKMTRNGLNMNYSY